MSRTEIFWALTVDRHDISPGAGAHDNLVVFAAPVLPSNSSPELTVGGVGRREIRALQRTHRAGSDE